MAAAKNNNNNDIHNTAQQQWGKKGSLSRGEKEEKKYGATNKSKQERQGRLLLSSYNVLTTYLPPDFPPLTLPISRAPRSYQQTLRPKVSISGKLICFCVLMYDVMVLVLLLLHISCTSYTTVAFYRQ